MCFIGHGAFGMITKPIWCNYFAVFGIGPTAAYNLMPVVGAVDILLGVFLLFYPLRFSAVWLVFWVYLQRYCVRCQGNLLQSSSSVPEILARP